MHALIWENVYCIYAIASQNVRNSHISSAMTGFILCPSGRENPLLSIRFCLLL